MCITTKLFEKKISTADPFVFLLILCNLAVHVQYNHYTTRLTKSQRHGSKYSNWCYLLFTFSSFLAMHSYAAVRCLQQTTPLIGASASLRYDEDDGWLIMNHMTAKQTTPAAQLCTGFNYFLCLRVFGLNYLCAMRNHNHFYVDMCRVVSFVHYLCRICEFPSIYH